MPFIKRFFVLLCFFVPLVFSTLTGQLRADDDPPGPKTIAQIGLANTQMGDYISGAEVLWADYDAIRADFPLLRNANNALINQLIIQNSSYLTHLQANYRGIFITPYEVEAGGKVLFHPLGYNRASVVEFLAAGQTVFTPQGLQQQIIPLGLLDLKGTGIGSDAEQGMEDHLKRLKALDPGLVQADGFVLDDSDLNRYREQLKALEKTRETLRSELESAESDSVEKRSTSHGLQINRERRRALEIFFEEHERLSPDSSPATQQAAAQRYLRHIRSMDYTNGIGVADRMLKEIIMARAARRVMAEVNSTHGTRFGVLNHYFLLGLPAHRIRPDGSKGERLAILGRQPHWRDHTNLNQKINLPPELFGAVLSGGVQGDVFGRLVDMEIPAIRDTRVREFLDLNFMGTQPIERMAAAAVTAFESGDRTAIETLVRTIDDRFQSGPSAADQLTAQPSWTHKVADATTYLRLRKIHRKIEDGTATLQDALPILELADKNEKSYIFQAQAALFHLSSKNPQLLFQLLEIYVARRAEHYADTTSRREAATAANKVDIELPRTDFVLLQGPLVSLYLERPDLGVRILNKLEAISTDVSDSFIQTIALSLFRLEATIRGEKISGYIENSRLHESIVIFLTGIYRVNREVQAKNLPQVNDVNLNGRQLNLIPLELYAAYGIPFEALMATADRLLGNTLHPTLLEYLNNPNHDALDPGVIFALAKRAGMDLDKLASEVVHQMLNPDQPQTSQTSTRESLSSSKFSGGGCRIFSAGG